eukprot:TRINITY_DN3012_c0_g1_i2.p1 TRINITY_DN3012_c0_g1~~TRINITY_DN3012_c0_g1_i2.p1  ORF type:complete len:356 (+),score=80.27 TRINITY_DN3012_c0_g1_i2:53-1120(+)
MRLCVPCVGGDGKWWVTVCDGEGHETERCQLETSQGDEIKEGVIVGQYLYLPGLKMGRIYVLELEKEGGLSLSRVVEGLVEPWGCCTAGDNGVFVSVKSGIMHVAPPNFKAEAFVTSQDALLPGALVCREHHVVSTSWADATAWPHGFHRKHAAEGKYGSYLYLWDTVTKAQPVEHDLGLEGVAPSAVTLFHHGEGVRGYTSCSPATTVFYFTIGQKGFEGDKVIHIPKRDRLGVKTDGMTTGLALSKDDRLLYLANWLHGDIRQYDVTTPTHPVLVGRLVLPSAPDLGPAAITLASPETLFISTCFLPSWHPHHFKCTDAPILKVNADPIQGGLTLDGQFNLGNNVLCMTPVLV